MAFHQVESSIPVKMSFAKVVAMPAPNVAPALPHPSKETKKPVSNPSQNQIVSRQPTSENVGRGGSLISGSDQTEQSIEKVRSAIEGLGLVRDRSDTVHYIPSNGTCDSFRDDQSNMSDSQAEQQSFETKSMASVTTFAMDEKESIRPDDSASVRAADDDEPHETFGKASRIRHDLEQPAQSQKPVMRVVAPGVTIATRRYPGVTLVNPPRFGDLPIEPITGLEAIAPPDLTAPVETITIDQRSPDLVAPPDEKLLEALASVKDRLPLLLLEEKFIRFITQANDEVLELPPQNSFTRLLSHKLADYYNLAHQVSEDNTSVRIFRTRYTTLPTPLAEIARATSTGPTPASTAAQVKIMRRVQLGRGFSAGNSTAASSSVASKATSENGAETNSEEGLLSPVEGTPNRDKSKLTREEREAQYKAARERIFGDFQESVTSESGSTGETSASMSRSSSSSGKKKSRKHKTPKDDSFEARSAFTASYTPMYMQTGHPQAYSEMQFPGAYSTPTSNYPANMYGAVQATPYSPYDPNMYGSPMSAGNGMAQPYANNEGWQNMQQPQGYNYQQAAYQPQTHLPQQFNGQYQQPQQSNIPVGWSANQSQNPYQHPQNGVNAQWAQYGQQPNAMPYQYGQLPSQSYHTPIAPTTQHPVPGSYGGARSLFNPQTRSFVPGGNPGRTNSRNSRKKGGQTPTATRSTETSSNSSSANAAVFSPRSRDDSLQSKYGTPPNLPKKPPPSQNISHFSGDHSSTPTLQSSGGSSNIATAAKVVANGDVDENDD